MIYCKKAFMVQWLQCFCGALKGRLNLTPCFHGKRSPFLDSILRPRLQIDFFKNLHICRSNIDSTLFCLILRFCSSLVYNLVDLFSRTFIRLLYNLLERHLFLPYFAPKILNKFSWSLKCMWKRNRSSIFLPNIDICLASFVEN